VIYVSKWDGRREPFERGKLVRTLLRLKASEAIANEIVDEIEGQLYDGIATKEILGMAYKQLEAYKPSAALMRDLKTALGRMKPMPDFEEYVRILLRAKGYRVAPNRTIQGFCVIHEIDGIVEKGGETIYLEVKNHSKPHILTPFGVTLAAKAKGDDIQKGYEKGLNEIHFDRVLIVCNTRLTQHAKKYAKCMGIGHIGWNTPKGEGIDAIITETNLYPVTILKTLSAKEHDRLSEAGIITLDQLRQGLSKIRMKESRKRELISAAELVLSK
jgi:hypothetical protein